MSGITFLKQNPSKLGWDSPIRKMVCGLSFLIWLALLQNSLAVNVPGPNGTVVTQILSATSSNPEVKVVEDRDLGKILVYPPQPKEFTVEIIARIMYPDDQYLEKISTVMVGGAGVTIESDEIRNSLILATLKVAPGASGGRFSITYENEDNPNHKGCNVRLLPVDLRDIKGSGDSDDVAIKNWNGSNPIPPASIAWIEPHLAANDAPQMPQLEFRIPGLPDKMKVKAKLRVVHERAYFAQAAKKQDVVELPAGGGFKELDDDSWKMWEDYKDEPFFGGEATLTYKIEGADEKMIKFRIGGKNPNDVKCKAYIEKSLKADNELKKFDWFGYAIAKSESKGYNGKGDDNAGDNGIYYNQFMSIPGHPRDNGLSLHVRADSLGERGSGGVGICQVTGLIGDPNKDAPRGIFWNWHNNVDAFVVIFREKWKQLPTPNGNGGWTSGAYPWMNSAFVRPKTGTVHGQRNQAKIAIGKNVPVLFKGKPHKKEGIVFADGTATPIEHAVVIKHYNGSHPAFYCSWGNGEWKLSETNGNFDYVKRILQELDE